MALYDYIRLQWSDGCDIDNIYYKGGFQNEMFFVEDLSTPQYEIEDEVKKQDGVANAERQIWYKKFTLEIKCVEAVADILTSIPLHETVTVSDKNGNAFTCGGADVEIDVTPAEVPELIEGTYYPVAFVKFTFTADRITKTACCPADQLVECGDTDAPVIDTITEPVAGSVKITGTADETTLIRLRYREFLESIQVGNGIKVNDVCFVSATVAYCCSNLGGVYKTTNGGQTWAVIGSTGGVQLNGIAFDGTDKIYAVGDVTGGQAACVVATVGVDTLANVNTALNENLKAVSFADATNGYACGAGGSVLYFNGVWANITPGTVTVLRDIQTISANPNVIFTVGLNYVCWSEDYGVNWTITNYAGEDFNACCTPENNKHNWYFGNTNGDIRYSTDDGATSAIEKAGAGTAITGITAATVAGQLVVYALYSNGTVLTDEFHDITWTNTWKIKGAPVCNRIRALTGTRHEILVAQGTEYCSTTETLINDGNYSTAAIFNVDGLTQALVNNVTYEVDLETYLLNSDPCKDCDNELFTT